MTISNKTTLKTYFETGDFPTQSNFGDLIDSLLGLSETSSQTIQGPIVVSGAASFRTGVIVSGATGFYGDIVFGASAASTARTSLGLGSAAVLDTGVSANNVVKLDSLNRLPAVNASLLTGLPASGALTLLTSANASNSSSVDFTANINSTYKKYIIECIDIIPASGGVAFNLRVSEDGVTFISTASYKNAYKGETSNNAGSDAGNTGLTSFSMLSTNVTTALNGQICFYNPAGSALNKHFLSAITAIDSSGFLAMTICGGLYSGSNNAILGVRLFMGTGNITSGIFKLYGVS